MTDQSNYVEGLVTFTGFVNITEKMRLETDLLSRYLTGIDLEEWKNNAVFIDNGLIPG